MVHMYFVHSVPACFCFINFLLTDIVPKRKHVVFIATFGTLFGFFNKYKAFVNGKSHYPFLPWIENPL